MDTAAAMTADRLGAPETAADPYPLYAALREQSPVSWEQVYQGVDGVERRIRFWAMLRYAEVDAALRDHATFSSQLPGVEQGEGFRITLQLDDPPRHTQLRSIVSRA